MIGWEELILIVVLAIVLLGPENLTDIVRKIGKLYLEYNRAKKRLELEIKYGIPLDDSIFEREIKDIYTYEPKNDR